MSSISHGCHCPSTPESRWVFRPQAATSEWELILHGTHKKLSVKCQEDRRPVWEVDGQWQPWEIEDTVAADLNLAFEDWRQQQSTRTVPHGWEQLQRYAEIGATARRSLTRRRTLDLHYEDSSERTHFKSQMTAIGCGTLLWTMFGMIALLTFASVLDPRDREYRTAAASNFVLSTADFEPGSQRLTPPGQARLQAISQHWSSTSPILIVEQPAVGEPEQNRLRMSQVLSRLGELGIRNPEFRTEIRPLPGKWFERAMVLGWLIVFLPLALPISNLAVND